MTYGSVPVKKGMMGSGIICRRVRGIPHVYAHNEEEEDDNDAGQTVACTP